MKRLGTDLTSAQKEMKAKHKAYENAVGILSRRLQEALTDKETAEAELVKLKAQVSDGGNSQVLQVIYKPASPRQFSFKFTATTYSLAQNLRCKKHKSLEVLLCVQAVDESNTVHNQIKMKEQRSHFCL